MAKSLEEPVRPEGQMRPEMQDAIGACMKTYSQCEQTMTHCLQQGGRYVDRSLMAVLMDCSDMTRVCADMMIRQSPMAMEMAKMCAQVASKCADACMAMSDDQMMQRCAEACRACAEACRAMTVMPA